MRLVTIAAAVALAASPLAAHAETKAWAAAKAGLPADTKLVIGIDMAALTKTQLFSTYYQKVLAKADASDTRVIDAVKAACKLDPMTSVQSVVIATNDRGSDGDADGAAYIAFNGLDKAKLATCLPAAIEIAHAQKAKEQAKDKDAKPVEPKADKVAIKNDGNITVITKGDTTSYIAWTASNVLVVPFHATDKAALTRWMSGKGALAKTSLQKSIAKANTSATIWGAGELTKELQPGTTLKGGYGSFNGAKGNLDVDTHLTLGSAEQATKLATDAKNQIEQAQKGGMLPPALAGLVKGVAISAANDELVIKASATEKDVMSALDMAMALMGGS